jgi:putative ABC transport system permease protein
MNLAGMAVRNLARHPIRTGLTVLGVACAAATVFAILGFDRGYERALRDELTRTGVHLFVSTEGCPSVAATMLIRGGELPRYMTDAHLAEARTTPGVSLAGGYLIATGIPPEGGGIDLFFGITEEVPRLKPEWHLDGAWFSAPDAAEAILGATMAERFQAAIGSSITIPSLAREVRVVGILERTRSQDDQFIFLPIQTAQRWFRKDGKLTAIGVQAESVEQIPAVKTALERMPDAYVVPAEAMSQEILTLVGGTKALMTAVVGIVLVVSILGLANTLIMAAMERRMEFAVLRCVGASPGQLAMMTVLEAAVIALVGVIVGTSAGWIGGGILDAWIRRHLPYAPSGDLLQPDLMVTAMTGVAILILVLAAALWPAWRTARIAPLEALRHG